MNNKKYYLVFQCDKEEKSMYYCENFDRYYREYEHSKIVEYTDLKSTTCPISSAHEWVSGIGDEFKYRDKLLSELEEELRKWIDTIYIEIYESGTDELIDTVKYDDLEDRMKQLN